MGFLVQFFPVNQSNDHGKRVIFREFGWDLNRNGDFMGYSMEELVDLHRHHISKKRPKVIIEKIVIMTKPLAFR